MLTIENTQLRVEIDEMGAQLTHAIDKNGNFDFIWNGSEWKRHAPILFPAIGRSNGNKYLLNGKTYEMKQHGFARDYSWTVVDKGDDRVSLTFTENEETLKFYPFKFSLMVTYSLEGNMLHVKFAVHNNSEIKMPFALGFHPGFNLPIVSDQLEFSDYTLSFMPEVQTLTQFEINPIPFRDGKVIPVKGANHSNLPLNYKNFEDGLIIINNPGLTKASLTSSKSDHEIDISLEEFEYVALWTLEDGSGKFLCIEPFNGLPDIKSDELTDWNNKEGNQILAPGEKAEYTTTITLK